MTKWSVCTAFVAIMAAALFITSCATETSVSPDNAGRRSATASFTSAHFEPVFEGRELAQPIEMSKLKSSIQLALIDLNWRTISQTASSVSAEFQKDEGEVRATIKVVFSTSGYQIEYVDSRGLNVDLQEKTIHRNYMRWVRNLDKEIATNYIK
jgi:hypothetical protein